MKRISCLGRHPSRVWTLRPCGPRIRVSQSRSGRQITKWSCGKTPSPITTAHNQHIRSHITERQSMARVTVEDCIDKVDNRFDLVLLAAHRARMISSGSQLTVDRDNDKNPVVSLREIADSTISPEDLREELVHSLQKFVEVDEPEPDTVPLDRLGGRQRRCRRHRGRRRAHDRGGAAQGPRRPGAAGRAARRGRVSRPCISGVPVPLELTQKARTLSGPLLLLTFS